MAAGRSQPIRQCCKFRNGIRVRREDVVPQNSGGHFEEFVDEPILTPDATPANTIVRVAIECSRAQAALSYSLAAKTSRTSSPIYLLVPFHTEVTTGPECGNLS